MELTLLGTVAVAAFLVGGAAVMLVSAFRRTIELRRALIEALARIENLEAAIVAGRPLNVTVTATQTETVAALAQGAPKLLEAPRVAELAEAIEATDRIEPPAFAIAALGALLASAAALSAAHVQVLSGQGGVVLTLLVGAAVIGAAEWRRRDRAQRGADAPSLNLDLWTAILGLGLMLAAILYGRFVFGAVPPHAAVGAVAMLSLGALALSYWHGLTLAYAALGLAMLAPALSPIQAPGAWGQYAFLALVGALTLWTARVRQARVLAWLALAPALFWGANLAWIGGVEFNIGVGGVFLAAIAGVALTYAGPSAVALSFPRFWSAPWREPMVLGHAIATAATIAFAVLLIRHPAGVSHAGAALLIFTIVIAGAGAVRPGLWLALALAFVAALAVIGLWPLAQLDMVGAISIGAAAAALLGLAGAVAMSQASDRRPGAWLAAAAPIAIGAACYASVQGWTAHYLWSIAAAGLVALNWFGVLRYQHARAVASAFIFGVAASGVALAAALAPPAQQAFALATALPVLALLHRWRPNLGLRVALGTVLTVLILILIQDGAGRPWLLALSALTIACAGLAYFYGRLPPTQPQRSAAKPESQAAVQPEMFS